MGLGDEVEGGKQADGPHILDPMAALISSAAITDGPAPENRQLEGDELLESEHAREQPRSRTEPGDWSNDARSTGPDSELPHQHDMEWRHATDHSPRDLQGNLWSRKRTPRQQEQNKHAQKRYRARRKAQFADLQEMVADLTAQVKALEQDRQALEEQLARFENTHPPHPPPPPPQLPPTVLASHPTPKPPSPPQPHSTQNNHLSAAQIRDALGAFGRELWSIMHMYNLNDQEAEMAVMVSQDTLATLHQAIKLGIELTKLVLHTNGSDAEVVLHDGAAATMPCIADAEGLWKGVVEAVTLSPQQVAQVAAWRNTFLARLDAVYKQRMGLKQQALQTPDAAAASSQWAEALLLPAAQTIGYALSAQADAELCDVVEKMRRNVDENRAGVVAAVAELLTGILRPVQAVRYLATSHPFSWNVLAFAHAVATTAG